MTKLIFAGFTSAKEDKTHPQPTVKKNLKHIVQHPNIYIMDVVV